MEEHKKKVRFSEVVRFVGGEFRATADLSLWMLLGSNILFGALFVSGGGEFEVLLWTFWAQSVIIGLFNFLRILKQENFSTEGFTSNGRRVPQTPKGRSSTARFFLMHYGLFHVIYAGFLIGEAQTAQVMFVVVGALIFFVNHGFSFLRNNPQERHIRKNLGALMFYPYVRIIPMHAIIVSGAFISGGPIASIAFLAMKTVADMLMHIIEHRIFNKPVAERSFPTKT